MLIFVARAFDRLYLMGMGNLAIDDTVLDGLISLVESQRGAATDKGERARFNQLATALRIIAKLLKDGESRDCRSVLERMDELVERGVMGGAMHATMTTYGLRASAGIRAHLGLPVAHRRRKAHVLGDAKPAPQVDSLLRLIASKAGDVGLQIQLAEVLLETLRHLEATSKLQKGGGVAEKP